MYNHSLPLLIFFLFFDVIIFSIKMMAVIGVIGILYFIVKGVNKEMKIKTIAIVVIVLGLLALILVPCYAEDGNNVADQLGDICTGKGNVYGGLELNHIPLPVVPATLTLWGDSKLGKIDDGVPREVRGGFVVAVDWRDIFK